MTLLVRQPKIQEQVTPIWSRRERTQVNSKTQLKGLFAKAIPDWFSIQKQFIV